LAIMGPYPTIRMCGAYGLGLGYCNKLITTVGRTQFKES
jgi:hypothetical protein